MMAAIAIKYTLAGVIIGACLTWLWAEALSRLARRRARLDKARNRSAGARKGWAKWKAAKAEAEPMLDLGK